MPKMVIGDLINSLSPPLTMYGGHEKVCAGNADNLVRGDVSASRKQRILNIRIGFAETSLNCAETRSRLNFGASDFRQ